MIAKTICIAAGLSAAIFSFAQECPATAVCAGEVLPLAWHDEFNVDGAPDSTYWNYERGFVRNHEEQWYQHENAVCRDGLLIIEGRKEAPGRPNPLYNPSRKGDWRASRPTIDYTAASINTAKKFEFTYGRVEVRAKIPTASGAWPAIWLLGRSYEWPSGGEIDMMEYYRIDGVPHILANACWGSDKPHHAIWNSKATPFAHFTDRDPDWADKFHVWAMDWTPESISLYLDGELLNRIPLSQTINGILGQGDTPVTKPQYLLLNLAMGGDHGAAIDDSSLPMTYLIDYIRVYSK